MIKYHHRGRAPPLHTCRTSSEPFKYRLNRNDPTSRNIRPALFQGGSPVDKLFRVARLVSHALSLAHETAVFKPSMTTVVSQFELLVCAHISRSMDRRRVQIADHSQDVCVGRKSREGFEANRVMTPSPLPSESKDLRFIC